MGQAAENARRKNMYHILFYYSLLFPLAINFDNPFELGALLYCNKETGRLLLRVYDDDDDEKGSSFDKD